MTDYRMIDVDEQSYLYVERTCSMDPGDISKNMGIAYQTVADLIAKEGIRSVGHAISVYRTYDPAVMTFEAGFLVSAEDAQKAEGDVRSGVLPAGKVLNYIHRGPYATLRLGYGKMMEYLAKTGKTVDTPTWEVYPNNPSEVDTEDDLETDIYVTISEG